MHTMSLMILSSVVLAIVGLGMTFAPQEIVTFVAGQSSKELTLLIQVIGAGYLGFAALNWMARANLMGGIYSRPVSIGNFMHFLVAAIALAKAAAGDAGGPAIIVAVAIYAALAIAFGWVAFAYSPGAKVGGRQTGMPA